MNNNKKRVIFSSVLVFMVGVNSYAAGKNQLVDRDYKENKAQLTHMTSTIMINQAFKTSPSQELSEDGEATAPDPKAPAKELTNLYSSSKDLVNDFNEHIPFSDILTRDHTSLNTYYFQPTEYLLKRDELNGFNLNFLHLNREQGLSEDAIFLKFTLSPKHLTGGVELLKILAKYKIDTKNSKAVELKSYPISDVDVSLLSLEHLIPKENISTVKIPARMGGDIVVQARLSPSQKEHVVASIREGGLSGIIKFTSKTSMDGSVTSIIPYQVDFSNFSGKWVSEINNLETGFTNKSPFPIDLKGIVAYVEASNGGRLKRYYQPLEKTIRLQPGATSSSNMSFQQLFPDKGNQIASWAVFDNVKCEPCLDKIERKLLVAAGLTSKTEIPIEVIPSVFNKFGIFKILVQVKSSYFTASGKSTESKTITLKPGKTESSILLYVDRDSGNEKAYKYRIQLIFEEGGKSEFSTWQSNDEGAMDITITPKEIRPLLNDVDSNN